MIQENPKRPPRGWFRRCMKGVQKSGARNPNAVCGSVWYHKLSQADRRRITHESEGYAENPTSGALIAGGVVAAAVLAWVFWPKKAAATPGIDSSCGTQAEVKSFIAARGLGVDIVDNAPTTEVPPTGYDTTKRRVYALCSFYRFLSLDGAKSGWTKDTALNAEFSAWKAGKT